MVEFTRPFLYPKQLDAMFCQERYGLIEASTKSGKTVSAIAWIIERAFLGKPGNNFWWVAPNYIQASIAYTRIKQTLTKGAFTPFDTPTPRLQLLNGVWVWFRSADNADALYGEDVYAAVIDEASRVSEPSWHAVRSTLTATRGPVRIIGNVKGRKNWFYDLSRQAEAEMASQPDASKRRMHYAKITANDAVAAGVLDQEEIDDAKSVYTENVFKELYLAEPSDDSGNPFGSQHIQACVNVKGLGPGPVVAWGIDLAKSTDFLVLIGLNENGEVAAFHRWQGKPWRKSIREIWQIVGEDTPALVDSTGLGDPVLEELQFEHGNFTGFHFSSTAKQKLMEGLAVSIQGHEIKFPKGYISQELEIFEYDFTKTGVKYAAPEGKHDDCVCALALARQCWTEVAPGENIMKFYANSSQRMRELQAKLPEDNNRPWQEEKDPILIDDVVGKELEELYNETVAKTLPSMKRICFHCNEEVIGPNRITDGELFWHVGCAGATKKRNLN